jgi:hypothetical protein
MVSRIAVAGIAVLGVLALAPAALAEHGKVGLWDDTTTATMPSMMPPMSPAQMAQLSPAQMAQMQAMQKPVVHGVHYQFCMTPAEVASDNPPTLNSKTCSWANVTAAGHSFSGDVVCAGKLYNGTGHFSLSFDSDEHYTGQISMSGVTNGQSVKSSSALEGKWVSADCGAVK